MAERNEKVLERVRQELGRNPDLGSRELYAAVQKADKEGMQDTLQQFHARYVLPIKREQRKASGGAGASKSTTKRRRSKKSGDSAPAPSPTAGGRTRRGRKSKSQDGTERDRVRALLLQFAQDLTDAESRSGLVQVLGRVDQYVSRIVP